MHNQNAVETCHRAQAVCDDKQGRPCELFGNGLRDEAVGAVVDGGSGFVKKDDLATLEDGPGETEKLPFPSG